jgi:hypothetical protein
LEIFYKPYLKYLDELKEMIKQIDNSFDPHGAAEKPVNWKTPVLFIIRSLQNVYNVFDKKELLKN